MNKWKNYLNVTKALLVGIMQGTLAPIILLFELGIPYFIIGNEFVAALRCLVISLIGIHAFKALICVDIYQSSKKNSSERYQLSKAHLGAFFIGIFLGGLLVPKLIHLFLSLPRVLS